MSRTPKMTRSQQRLFDLFKQVEDEDLREIMIEVVFLEAKHRSGNFPRKKVRDIVDAVAKLQEAKENEPGG
jgi:hypothetical protein